MDSNTIPFLVAGALSLFPPFVFIGIRQAVKINRQEIVRDLAAVFSLPDSSTDTLIPSFEFVKYKYFFKRAGQHLNTPPPKDHSLISWLIGALPLVMLLFAISYLVASILWPVVATCIFASTLTSNPSCAKTDFGMLWPWSLCASFAGGYVFMIRSFYRAINNFDLSPLSFAGACNNLLVGMIGALVVFFLLISPATQAIGSTSLSISSTVLLSFAIGYLPEVATRYLLWRSDLWNFKRENSEIYRSFLTTPVEIIDGIDTETRDRLADYHIRSTQNLAATNPLMLFVETPFGVYQIMDWVAQAQLCTSVGPEALVKLWKLGIRTLFDLERIALDADCYDPDLLRQVGMILLNAPAAPAAKRSLSDKTTDPVDSANPTVADSQEATATSVSSAQATAGLNEATIVCNIVVRLDDPHVHRLRQIYIRVGERLGPENRRLNYKNRFGPASVSPPPNPAGDASK